MFLKLPIQCNSAFVFCPQSLSSNPPRIVSIKSPFFAVGIAPIKWNSVAWEPEPKSSLRREPNSLAPGGRGILFSWDGLCND